MSTNEQHGFRVLPTPADLPCTEGAPDSWDDRSADVALDAWLEARYALDEPADPPDGQDDDLPGFADDEDIDLFDGFADTAEEDDGDGLPFFGLNNTRGGL